MSTTDEKIKVLIGELHVNIAILRTENEELKEKLDKLENEQRTLKVVDKITRNES